MRVLKVTLEGITTSFRYPHFMVNVQPSYRMPPPATIYGHICSALGEWVSPDGLAFAYHFTYDATFDDLEHIHVLSASGGKVPGTNLPKALEGNVNPFRRELLFHPQLTLYLNRPEWVAAFQSPRYAVTLGRSQDLCSYTSVEEIELIEHDRVYLEHTLLPFQMATQTVAGIVTLMPRWLDYQRQRAPTFGRYLLLERRVMSDTLIDYEQEHHSFLADPSAARVNDTYRGLVFHTFTGDDNAPVTHASISG
jgi:CRISPR-associated protein Cas5t